MSLLGNLLIAISKVISLITGVYSLIIAGAVIISWVRPDPYNPIVIFLNQVTEPIFQKVRKFLPAIFFKSGIDWTPMVVIIVLILIENIVGETLLDWGHSLRYGTVIPR